MNGFCIWFTGLPCSGKTTIADALAKELTDLGLKVERLDGDVVRKSLCKDLGFSKEDRDKNIDRVTFVAKLLSRNEVAVIVSFISPYRKARFDARQSCTNFIEVYMNTPIEICEQRDVKGMYAKARKGEIKDFTGVDDPYEPPLNPEIELKNTSIEESVETILNYLQEKGFITNRTFIKNVYSPDEEAKIKKRLEDLGYI
ncbi:MAG: adenylyl-sulfate kinase [Candidatus Coatesbacteria bacterium]|nr:adenylyl-sulfate kinase [Candidatus Coatesbacteria bacterium]